MAESDGASWEAYHYDPSIVAAIIFCALFFAVTFLHLYQLVRTRTWVFIPFVVGGFFEAVGYIGRIMSSQQTPDWTLGPFIIQSLLILIAPALYAASIYMVLGRIILLTDGEHHSIFKKKWLTKIFVCGDVVSFVTQGAGGGIMATGNGSNYNLGQNIIIAGLCIQILVFGFFIFTAAIFEWRMCQVPTKKIRDDITLPWLKHLHVLYWTSGLILLRSIFRLIEYAMGDDGYLLANEVFLYVFDAVPMFAVMVWFALVHPSEVYALLKGRGHKVVRQCVKIYRLESLSPQV